MCFWNKAWPHYKRQDNEAWPENKHLNYNTILQLDIFCKRQGKWREALYVQVFTTLRENRAV